MKQPQLFAMCWNSTRRLRLYTLISARFFCCRTRWLDKAYEQRDSFLAGILLDPLLDRLRPMRAGRPSSTRWVYRIELSMPEIFLLVAQMGDPEINRTQPPRRTARRCRRPIARGVPQRDQCGQMCSGGIRG